MFSSFIFLLIAVVAGAGASISYNAYKHVDPKLGNLTEQAENKDFKKEIEEAVKPHLEQTIQLKQKVAEQENIIKDLKVAVNLAPEEKKTNGNGSKA